MNKRSEDAAMKERPKVDEVAQNKKFLEVLENEPLDSAARKVFEDWIPTEVLTIDGCDGGMPLYNQGALIMMFYAGAKWMAEQGVSIEGILYEGGLELKHIIPLSFQTNKKEKVIVQIRKAK